MHSLLSFDQCLQSSNNQHNCDVENFCHPQSVRSCPVRSFSMPFPLSALALAPGNHWCVLLLYFYLFHYTEFFKKWVHIIYSLLFLGSFT